MDRSSRQTQALQDAILDVARSVQLSSAHKMSVHVGRDEETFTFATELSHKFSLQPTVTPTLPANWMDPRCMIDKVEMRLDPKNKFAHNKISEVNEQLNKQLRRLNPIPENIELKPMSSPAKVAIITEFLVPAFTKGTAVSDAGLLAYMDDSTRVRCYHDHQWHVFFAYNGCINASIIGTQVFGHRILNLPHYHPDMDDYMSRNNLVLYKGLNYYYKVQHGYYITPYEIRQAYVGKSSST